VTCPDAAPNVVPAGLFAMQDDSRACPATGRANSDGTRDAGPPALAIGKYARLDSNQRALFTQSLGIVPRFAWPTCVGPRWAGIVPAA
jgi:hypothetical protein